MQLLRYCITLLCLSGSIVIGSQYRYIAFLKDVTLSDIELVGGKNASLGQMISA